MRRHSNASGVIRRPLSSVRVPPGVAPQRGLHATAVASSGRRKASAEPPPPPPRLLTPRLQEWEHEHIERFKIKYAAASSIKEFLTAGGSVKLKPGYAATDQSPAVSLCKQLSSVTESDLSRSEYPALTERLSGLLSSRETRLLLRHLAGVLDERTLIPSSTDDFLMRLLDATGFNDDPLIAQSAENRRGDSNRSG